jgi:3-keto-disaccharide hydrolase
MTFKFTSVAIVASIMLAIVSAAAAQEKPAEPFNGKNLDGWKVRGDNKDKSKWTVGSAKVTPSEPGKLAVSSGGDELVNATAGGVDIYSEDKWGDARIEVEFMVPKGSNSGVYVMGEYEVQILDSYGRERVGPGDVGGLYGAAAPKVNASRKPGEWQKFVIEFQAPRFEGEKKVANAKFLKVILNDQVIHENVEMKGPTPTGVSGKEAAKGPLMFQGDHGPVAYRNIKITPRNN